MAGRSCVVERFVITLVACLSLAVLVGKTRLLSGVSDATILNLIRRASADTANSAYHAFASGADTASRRLQLANNSNYSYPDVQMPQQCTPGQGCTSGQMPQERGLCVKSGLTEACWDVCNVQHTPQSYQVAPGSPLNSAMAGMVASVREGKNSFVQCPESLGLGDPCNPGTECSEQMRQQYNVPQGQGMCVVDSSQPTSRACWDMCDFSHPVLDYTTGTAAGTRDKVNAMRNSRTCPSNNWWLPAILAAVAVIIILCCIAVILGVFYGKKKKGSASRLEAQPEFNHDYLSPPPDEQVPDNPDDYGQQPPDYGQHAQEYQQEYRSNSREMHAVDHQDHYGAGNMREDMLPPEPPRMEPMQMQQEPYPPAPDRRSNDLLAPISPSQNYGQGYQQAQYDQQMNAYAGGMAASRQNSGFPGAGSMRVGGLSEPVPLFQSVQPLVVPQTTAQMAPPDLLSQALPMQQQQRNPFINPADPLGMSQPGTFPHAMQAPSFPNAFQTQLPGSFTQGPMPAMSPPTSMQGVGAGNPFFTQLPRR